MGHYFCIQKCICCKLHGYHDNQVVWVAIIPYNIDNALPYQQYALLHDYFNGHLLYICKLFGTSCKKTGKIQYLCGYHGNRVVMTTTNHHFVDSSLIDLRFELLNDHICWNAHILLKISLYFFNPIFPGRPSWKMAATPPPTGYKSANGQKSKLDIYIFEKNRVSKNPSDGGGYPYLAHGLIILCVYIDTCPIFMTLLLKTYVSKY